MQTPETDITTEHHPSCKDRCVAECSASPRHAPREPGPRVRTFHVAPVAPLDRAPRALWEGFDEPEAVRRSGCALPLPETYTAHERVDARYSLDRWTRPDGIEDRRLDDAIRARDESRKSTVRRARDVAAVAYALRAAFPGVERSPLMRTRAASSRARDLFALAIGADPASVLPTETKARTNWEAVLGQGGLYVGLVWGLALVLFGRDSDPVSEHAIGRMLPGEPVRNVRPPFAGPSHVLAVASHDLPGLGGGSCPWPQEDPRMRRRTWAKADEMKVSSVHHGTDAIRGEHAVHRVLDARAVERRAGLTPHEHAAVAVLTDRSLTRDEKTARLREVEYLRRHGPPLPAMPAEVRKAIADVSDTVLLRAARDAERRLRAAVERVSQAGDALAPKRTEKPREKRPTPRPIHTQPVRATLAAGYL